MLQRKINDSTFKHAFGKKSLISCIKEKQLLLAKMVSLGFFLIKYIPCL